MPHTAVWIRSAEVWGGGGGGGGNVVRRMGTQQQRMEAEFYSCVP